MSYLDPHHVNRKNNLYYQRKGQTIPARLVDPSPLIDRSLVPFYLQYIKDNRLLPPTPSPTPHFPYVLSLSRFKIFPVSGGDIYPSPLSSISFTQSSYGSVTITFHLSGWYLGYLVAQMPDPYSYSGLIFFLYHCSNPQPLSFSLSVDGNASYMVHQAYLSEQMTVWPSGSDVYYLQLEYLIPSLSGSQDLFLSLSLQDYNIGKLYLSSFYNISNIYRTPSSE